MSNDQTPENVGRRKFMILASATAAGGLMVGLSSCSGPDEKAKAAASNNSVSLNAYVDIAPDNIITMMCPCPEMGQGTFTALPMLVADELDADWDKIVVKHAPADPAFNHPGRNRQYAGGSNSVRGFYFYLRQLGAATKEMLLSAAAEKWGVAVSECSSKDGVISHATAGSITYGEIAGAAAGREVQQDPTLKTDDALNLITKNIPRKDTPLKVNGSAIYGMDIVVPDMLVGTVKQNPRFNGGVKSYDDSKAREVRGFHSVVDIGNGIAVLADNYWHAKKALDLVTVEFENADTAGMSSQDISDIHKTAHDDKNGVVGRNDGSAREVIAKADRVIEATYSVPFLAHATMEPMNCTAYVKGGKCEVWAPTQAPDRARNIAAQTLGIDPMDVNVNVTFLGGGFGRRGNVDYVAQVALASKAAGRPVKLIWSREEDMQHDFYRPVDSTRMRVAVGDDGEAAAFEAVIAAPSVSAFRRPESNWTNKTDNSVLRLFTENPYDFAHNHVSHVRHPVPVPLGVWRSVALSNNTFSLEGFIDEVAVGLGRDPYEFRLEYLKNSPRHQGVLKLVAEKAGWGTPLPEGRGRGIAVVFGFGSYCAEVAEVSIVDGQPKVHKVVVAIDCGLTVNPGIIEAQVESSIVYGLTAALFGEITIDNDAVMQSNFDDYPMMHIGDMPEVEVHIVDSSENPGGVGEPATGPIAPSVTNAIYNLTRKRIRSLPFSKHNL